MVEWSNWLKFRQEHVEFTLLKGRSFSVFLLLGFFFLASPVWADAQEFFLKQACAEYQNPKCKTISKPLRTKKEACEVVRSAANCEKFEQEKPADSWKYIKCDYEQLCYQNLVAKSDSVAACMVGALSITSDAIERVMAQNEWIRECDKSVECKRKLAEGNPTTAALATPEKEKELKKYSAIFLYQKKVEYDPIRAQLMRNKQISVEEYYKELGREPVSTERTSAPSFSFSLAALWELIREKVESDVNEVMCYIPIEKTKLKCQVLGDVLLGTGIGTSLAKRTEVTGNIVERRSSSHLVKIAAASDPKKKLVEVYAQKKVTSVSENALWSKEVAKSSPRKRSVTVENSKLKDMNDKIFKDEEYVTALTNMSLDMQMTRAREVEAEIRKKYPYFKLNAFSDFKSLRFSYDDIPGADIEGLLRKAMSEANVEYADYLIKNNLVRTADRPRDWFKATVSGTDDWANLAVKYARENEGIFFVDGMNDPGFKTWARKQLEEGQKVRREVIETFKDTSLITKEGGRTEISRDVFEILRKNKDNPVEAKNLLEKQFALQPMSDVDFAKIQNFFQASDKLAPGLRNVSREFATFADAPNGGISIDMIGLGADHLQRTSARALANSDNVDQFLFKSRLYEQTLTDEIHRRKDAIEEIFIGITGDKNAKVLCSGDGCKAYLPSRALTPEETKKFADAVTRNGEQGRLRFSEVQGMKDRGLQDYVAKQGEDLEKSLRKNLSGVIDQRKLQGINLSVLIKTDKPGRGSANLHISEAEGFQLTSSEKKKIQEVYSRTLRESDMGYIGK